MRPLDPITAAYIIGQLAEGNANSPPRVQPHFRAWVRARRADDDVESWLMRLEDNMNSLVGDMGQLKIEVRHNTEFLTTFGMMVAEKLNLDVSLLLKWGKDLDLMRKKRWEEEQPWLKWNHMLILRIEEWMCR